MSQLLNWPLASSVTLYSPQESNWHQTQDAEDFYMGNHFINDRLHIDQFTKNQFSNLRWLVEHVKYKMNDLLSLGEGWDGHRGKAITQEAVQSVFQFVLAVCDELTFFPQFIPLPDGGIQIEWHTGGESIEIEIDGSGNAHVMILNSDREVTINEEVALANSTLVSTVKKAVHKLSIRVARNK